MGNEDFSKGLKLEPRKYYSPCLMDLNIFERCCGPEEGIKFRIPALDYRIFSLTLIFLSVKTFFAALTALSTLGNPV